MSEKPQGNNSIFNGLTVFASLLFTIFLLYQVALNLFFQNYWKSDTEGGIVLYIGNALSENQSLLNFLFYVFLFFYGVAIILFVAQYYKNLNHNKMLLMIVVGVPALLIIKQYIYFLPYIGAFFASIIFFAQKIFNFNLDFLGKTLIIFVNFALWVIIVKIIHRYLSSKTPSEEEE